ncbi:MAG TPA: YbhB/YbcL family Raf kinase inhibitor-like protein [Rudaea sp.]|nr:YbhB/YbcL family Raf kinase inhibitor-like protein [Rudaea sp.]
MQLLSNSLSDGGVIPVEFAFCKPGEPVAMSDNRNPHLAWSDIPDGTKSFVLTCVDPDVPSRPDDVNQVGREVPADLARVEFVHWVMTDIPADCREIRSGACSNGISARGKQQPPGPRGARQGINDYTSWFGGDADMAGDYYGYDGPCPPWNDSIVHHYHFSVYALDCDLGLQGRFGIGDARKAMQGHVLAQAQIVGLYSLNPRLASQSMR